MGRRRGPPKNVNRYDENYYKRPRKTKTTRFYQGKFKPKNPSKYRGNVDDIIFRSSWELQFMHKIDKDPNIIEWNSEGTVIPYYSDVDQKNRRYFIDFYIKTKDVNGRMFEYLVEIKPLSQIFPPKIPKGKLNEKRAASYANQLATYSVNHNKWTATCKWVERTPNMAFIIAYRDETTKQFVLLDAMQVINYS